MAEFNDSVAIAKSLRVKSEGEAPDALHVMMQATLVFSEAPQARCMCKLW